MKKQKEFLVGILLGLLLTGCGEDEALNAYQEDMETFFDHIVEFNDNMNAIDVTQPDYLTQMMGYLDGLDAEVAWMAALEVPEQFIAVESLADEASENMTQAVSLYHMAYEGIEYDANIEQAAREYYERANIRIRYIVTILHGEIPEGEDVIYTEEDKIFGGGYMNKTEEEDSDTGSATDASMQEGIGMEDARTDDPVDDFDTDDTVFYEE